jgi:hypothetical protein
VAFNELGVGEVNVTKHLNSGIATCSAAGNSMALDPAIKTLWLEMLVATYPNAPSEGAPEPKPDAWHVGFGTVLKAASGTARLFPFARHVAADAGLAYPDLGKVSKKFVENLKTPEGVMDYMPLFRRAVDNVVLVWSGLDAALTKGDKTYLHSLEHWNLDTGRTVPGEKFVFWKN